MFYRNANTIYYDNIGLFKEEFGESYQYDSKGNIISTQDLAKENSTFKYDGNNNLIENVNPKGGKFTYEYDTSIKGRLLKATNNSGSSYLFNYDSYGNTTSVKLQHPEKTSQYIENKATYTANGNYTSTLENQLEKQIQYSYNLDNGTVSSITDSNGNTTNYSYDALDRIASTTATDGNKTYKNEYTYNNDELSTIKHNGFNYSFTYDPFGNTKQVKLGNQLLVTNTYGPNNGSIAKIEYGNGQSINYTYDRFGRLLTQMGTNNNFNYSYDGRGNLVQIDGGFDGDIVFFQYDLANRLTLLERMQDNFEERYYYDKNSNVSRIESHLHNFYQTAWYNYDLDNKIDTIDASSFTVKYNYDDLQRNSSKEITSDYSSKRYNVSYSYTDVSSNKTTTQLSSIKNGNDDELKYTYDNNGNIKTISKGSQLLQTYYYDELNQLIREDNKELNKTILYQYDTGGNITSRSEYAYTTSSNPYNLQKNISYTYQNNNWKDQLTSYNNKTITYDEIGNPISYDNNKYTWQDGRQLTSISNSNLSANYLYDSNGIRIKKTVNGVDTYYSLRNDKVIFERTLDNILYYSYDDNGELFGVTYYNESSNDFQGYIYKKNLQGDIIGILDESLNDVVKYTYDSWGNIISITDGNGNEITDSNNIGILNPYRYKQYRYDTETGLYYLQSRYYDPEWGRFLNADGIFEDSVLGYNLYAYCKNNPINNIDPSGQLVVSIGTLLGLLAKPIIVATVGVLSTFGILGTAAIISDNISQSKDITKTTPKKPTSSSKTQSGILNKPYGPSIMFNKKKKTSSLPLESEPNSSLDLLNERGQLKQRRFYGPNGRSAYDIDYEHGGDGNHTFPHMHKWYWDGDKPSRLEVK